MVPFSIIFVGEFCVTIYTHAYNQPDIRKNVKIWLKTSRIM